MAFFNSWRCFRPVGPVTETVRGSVSGSDCRGRMLFGEQDVSVSYFFLGVRSRVASTKR